MKSIDCAVEVEACKQARGPNEFWLRILPNIPPDAGGEQMGFTQPEGIQCVNIIYPMVERLVRHLDVDAGQILGGNARDRTSLPGSQQPRPFIERGDVRKLVAGEAEAANAGELKFSGNQGARIRTAMNTAAAAQRSRTPQFRRVVA